MYNYKIIPREGIIIHTLSGKITSVELSDFFDRFRKDPDYSDQYSFVSDFRKATIVLTLDEIKEVALYYRDHCMLRGKNAILVNRSVDTARIILFKDLLAQKFSFGVYSTLEAASLYIGIDLDKYLDEDEAVREDVYI